MGGKPKPTPEPGKVEAEVKGVETKGETTGPPKFDSDNWLADSGIEPPKAENDNQRVKLAALSSNWPVPTFNAASNLGLT